MSDCRSFESVKKEIILVLGMVYSIDSIDNALSSYGQEWRDYQRISSLIDLGYEVYSLDDKHQPIIGKHCKANFNDPRRMIRSFKNQNSFPIRLHAKYILLDYFFSPVILLYYLYFLK
jgi:hypothetical protein